MVSITANRFTLEGTMFADSLLDVSWAQRSRRSWTTLTSFGLQAAAIGALLLFSLLQTVVLPTARVVSTPISVGRPAPMPLVPRPHIGSATIISNNVAGRVFMQPHQIPTIIAMGGDTSAAPPPGIIGDGISTGLPPGAGDGVPNAIFGRSQPLMPTPPAPAAHTFRTSSMLEGSIVRRVQPAYPPLARSARIQGSVVLSAVISKAGTIQNLRVVSGHPMLVTAAIDAVSQWRYRPYILNSEPVEVETQITVNFFLSGN
jgi:protein TonB